MQGAKATTLPTGPRCLPTGPARLAARSHGQEETPSLPGAPQSSPGHRRTRRQKGTTAARLRPEAATRRRDPRPLAQARPAAPPTGPPWARLTAPRLRPPEAVAREPEAAAAGPAPPRARPRLRLAEPRAAGGRELPLRPQEAFGALARPTTHSRRPSGGLRSPAAHLRELWSPSPSCVRRGRRARHTLLLPPRSRAIWFASGCARRRGEVSRQKAPSPSTREDRGMSFRCGEGPLRARRAAGGRGGAGAVWAGPAARTSFPVASHILSFAALTLRRRRAVQAQCVC